MKFVILFAALVGATLAVPAVKLSEQWKQFKATHDKQYATKAEEMHRVKIFVENLEKIEAHNKLYEQGLVSYKKAVNQFTDWTKEEFLAWVNRGKIDLSKRSTKNRTPYVPSNVAAPGSVDWRGSAVAEVKNQGQCGSCWSFATTGALEGQLALRRGSMVSLSEQNLVDCSGGYGNAGCDGGWMGSAFQYIHDNGIMSENDYPYEAVQRECRYDAGRSVTTVSGYVDLPSGDENSLLDAVANIGPVSIAIDATDELQGYGGGILYDNSCAPDVLNHGVLAVGYGNENGQDYWIIKNSWGGGWGEGGYFRLARNAGNNCGVATAPEYPNL